MTILYEPDTPPEESPNAEWNYQELLRIADSLNDIQVQLNAIVVRLDALENP